MRWAFANGLPEPDAQDSDIEYLREMSCERIAELVDRSSDASRNFSVTY